MDTERGYADIGFAIEQIRRPLATLPAAFLVRVYGTCASFFRNRATFPQVLFFLFSGASMLARLAGKGFSGIRTSFAYPSSLGVLLAVSTVSALLSRRVKPLAVWGLVFVVALLYATFRTAPLSVPFGEPMDVRVKVLSDYRVRRGALQYRAKVKGSYGGRTAPSVSTGARVLLNLPPLRDPPRRGDTVLVKGLFTPLPFERSEGYARRLKSGGFDAVLEGYGKGIEIIARPAPVSPIALANGLGDYVKMVNGRLLPWPQSEFAVSLFTGNRDGLPREVGDSFIRSGTMHLLAVSGLHFGFITLFFFSLFKLFRLDLRAIYVLLIGVTLFYMVFIGDAPSVRRSAVMVLCGVAVFLSDRDRNYFNVLAIAFDVLWCANPLAVFNPGFILSFSATFAILFLVPRIAPLLRRVLPEFFALSLSVSLGVQVYLWPVLLAYFGSFPYVNVVANIPLVPLTGLSLALEISTLILYPLSLPLAVVLSEVNAFVVTLILRFAAFFAKVPPLTLEGFPPFVVPAYFAAVTVGFALLFAGRSGERAPRERALGTHGPDAYRTEGDEPPIERAIRFP